MRPESDEISKKNDAINQEKGKKSAEQVTEDLGFFKKKVYLTVSGQLHLEV